MNRLPFYCFLAVGFMVFFYMPWLLIENGSIAKVALIGFIFGGLTVWLAVRFCNSPPCQNLTAKRKAGWLLLAVLVLGVSIRVAWSRLVPPVQLSDALDYWNAARRLLETGTYVYLTEGHELYAWRPPGYPFFLAGFIAVLGDQPWIPEFTNLLLYLLTSVALFSIARRIAGYSLALVAVTLLGLWPSFIFITGIAFNEPLTMFLFTTSFLAFLQAERSGWLYAAAAGVLTGLGALVRPALLVLPMLWICFVFMKQAGRGVAIQLTSIAILSMALVITPWTVRNYRIFGTPVLISTNGGDVFYRANNPLASGGFTPVGAKDLAVYKRDELLWNRTGYAWGLQWIMENPVEFLKLAVKKQGILLGEDETGVYWSLGRGHGVTGLSYKVIAGISNTWWLGIWVFGIIGVVRGRRFFLNDPRGGLLILMVLFFVAVHSVFESQPRHHLPFIGLLSIIASFGFYPSCPRSYFSVNRATGNVEAIEKVS